MANNRKVGYDKELLAANYLREQGMEILQMNFRVKQGEVDIVAKDGQYLVFVEVKYRTNTGYGYPEEAVTVKKQQTIRNVATIFLMKHKMSMDSSVRFDVVSILGQQIKHIRNAF